MTLGLPANICQGMGKDYFGHVVDQDGKFIDWFVACRILHDVWPCTFHELIGHSPEKKRIGIAQQVVVMLVKLIICIPCRVVAKPIQCHIDGGNQFSHSIHPNAY